MAFRRFAIATAIESLRPTNNTKVLSLSNPLGKAVIAENGVPVSFDYDPENFVYFRCRAITADTPNGNGDLFPEDQLKASYKTFVGVGLYKDHDSDSVDKSIGKVLWAEWIPEGKYVECYCAVDKKLAPDMAHRVEMGVASTVSMGCMVGEAECSIPGCGNIAHNQMELCEHMIPGRGIKGKKGADGKVAYEINRMLQFTELSLVTVPADPTAKIFEVFAGLQNGSVTLEDFRKFIREEVLSAVRNNYVIIPTEMPVTTTSSNSATNNLTFLVPATTPGLETKNAPVDSKSEEAVAKILDITENKMKLTISYLQGSNLTNSFFVGKEGDSEFKVAIADVIPLRVQEAIRAKDPGVATPAQVIADLTGKCETLAAFKAWAKKRKKKNRKAMEKMNEAPAAEEKKEADAAAPTLVADAPASSATEVLNPGPAIEPAQDAGDSLPGQTEPATGLDSQNPTAQDVEQAIQMLMDKLETMKNSSAKKTATQSTKDVMENKEKGESTKGKYAPAADPKATQEVAKKEEPKGHLDAGESTGNKYAPADIKHPTGMSAEEPKGHMDAGQSTGNKYAPAKVSGSKEVTLAKTAAEEPVWSVNPKEMEAKPKMSKPAQAAPPEVSWDDKEMASEQVKTEKGGNAGSQVKKYFNRLPSGALGEAPKALDLKSSTDPEKEMLKKALDKATAETAALKEKEQLQQVADKIYEIVKALREKNMLTAGQEDGVIEHLTVSFKKDLALLDGVLGLVAKLVFAESAPAESAAESVEVGNVVPQVFEPISNSEDAIATMAKIWNL